MEWFDDSLNIYWMNQCFWINLLYESFKDKYIFDSPILAPKKKGTQQSKFLVHKYPLPDLKHSILELELIFDS